MLELFKRTLARRWTVICGSLLAFTEPPTQVFPSSLLACMRIGKFINVTYTTSCTLSYYIRVLWFDDDFLQSHIAHIISSPIT